MKAFSIPRSGILTMFAACSILASVDGAASQERVDHATQAALELDAHPARGGEQFRRSCARCHGSDAQGDADHAIPALAGQRFRYIVRQLADFAGQERESSIMQRVIAHNTVREPQAWVDIAAYLNSLPVTARVQTGDGSHAALGRGIFHEQCASCHRGDARGDAEGFIPSLRNQHYSYLVTQLDKLAEGSRHNVDEDLILFWRGLDAEDKRATADYLSRLSGPGDVHKTMRPDGTVVD
jgi:cytochrome c553